MAACGLQEKASALWTNTTTRLRFTNHQTAAPSTVEEGWGSTTSSTGYQRTLEAVCPSAEARTKRCHRGASKGWAWIKESQNTTTTTHICNLRVQHCRCYCSSIQGHFAAWRQWKEIKLSGVKPKLMLKLWGVESPDICVKCRKSKWKNEDSWKSFLSSVALTSWIRSVITAAESVTFDLCVHVVSLSARLCADLLICPPQKRAPTLRAGVKTSLWVWCTQTPPSNVSAVINAGGFFHSGASLRD